MTIRNKLVLSSILTGVFFLVTGATLLIGYRYVTVQATIAKSFDNQSGSLQMMLRGINESIVTDGTLPSIAIAESGLESFENSHEHLLSITDDADIHQIHDEIINPPWENIKKEIQPFLDPDTDFKSDDIMVKYGKVISDTESLIKTVNDQSDKIGSVVDYNSKKTRTLLYIILTILFAALLCILGMSHKLYQSIISPIQELNTMAEGFGNGNFNVVMDESGKDEFALLAVQFKQAMVKLGNFISSLKDEISTLNDRSEELADKSSHIASNTKEQSNQTTHAATAMEELSSSFVDVAKNASNAALSAKEATDLAINGGKVVSETIEGMNRIADSVKSSAATIEILGNSSGQITQIIKVINDIAGQTNLLALNAAIEAARAGDQGRGFAVVADEVRKLAEKTTSSTNEIGEMIKNIQLEAHKSVEAMETGTKNVESGVTLANQAGESLKQIVQAVQKVTDMITQIATAAEEQSTTGEEIAANIEVMASITNNTANDAELSSSYSEQLSAMVSELKGMVAEFKLHSAHTSQAPNTPKTGHANARKIVSSAS